MLQEAEGNISRNHKLHMTLAHSYALYFFFFLLSVYLDFIFQVKIFQNEFAVPIGIAFLIWATFLIFWAQHTSRNLDKGNITKETFCRGPYCYTRSPTHWGLLLLLLGFGLISNAFFVVLFSVASFFISKFIFINAQEKILEEKYGAAYTEYKKAVRF